LDGDSFKPSRVSFTFTKGLIWTHVVVVTSTVVFGVTVASVVVSVVVGMSFRAVTVD
jgi:hypothetical protein